jgi:hypothetical protein
MNNKNPLSEAVNSAQVSQARDINSYPQTSRPEWFRLPSKGGDPYFGFSRTYYYEGEKRGWWHLNRIRERGKLRGITLVPYDTIAAFVRSKNDGKEPAK